MVKCGWVVVILEVMLVSVLDVERLVSCGWIIGIGLFVKFVVNVTIEVGSGLYRIVS